IPQHHFSAPSGFCHALLPPCVFNHLQSIKFSNSPRFDNDTKCRGVCVPPFALHLFPPLSSLDCAVPQFRALNPLKCADPKSDSITPLECAVTKNRGGRVYISLTQSEEGAILASSRSHSQNALAMLTS